MDSKVKKSLDKHLWTIVLLYLIVGLAWILLSDALVSSFFTVEQVREIQSYKGVFFVLITAILLTFVIHYKNKNIKDLFLRVQHNMQNFQDTFEQSAVGMAHVSLDGEWIRINQKLCDILGYQYNELLEVNVRSLTHPNDLPITDEKEQEIRNGQCQSYMLEKRCLTKSGDTVYVRLTKSAIKDDAGEIKYLSSIIEDITKQKEAENKLIESLRKQKKLLSEIHHRVKNNLAVISGLLELQSFHSKNDAVREILKNSMMRIKSMALIHEAYYKTGTLSDVYLDKYLDDFIHYIRNSYSNTYPYVILEYSTDKVSMNINQAITCGLLLNELLINVYIHAFQKTDKGTISIKLSQKEDLVNLKIIDNGARLPDSVNFKEPTSLSMLIINTLVKQLNGTIDLRQGDDTIINVSFTHEKKKGSASSITELNSL